MRDVRRCWAARRLTRIFWRGLALRAVPTLAALLFCTLLAALAVFQLALAFGAPLGHFAWGGQHAVLPRHLRIGSAVSIVLYAGFALLALDSAQLVSSGLGAGFVQAAMWVIAVYLLLGVAMNGISRSRPERLTMTPVALVLAGCAFVLASGV
jgi:hypothetical protein